MPFALRFRASAPRSPRVLHRAGWCVRYPAAASALVLLGAACQSPALRDAASGALASGWHLEADARYLAIAPLHGLLDQMTLLTLPQHVALVLTVVLLGAIGALRLSPRHAARPGAGTLRTVVVGGTLALFALLALCSWGAFGGRPMLRLAGAGVDQVVVDFHAHTHSSRDARGGWNDQRLREWLEGAGFDAAYVTDHGVLWPASWSAVSRGVGGDERVRLLPGVEVRGMGEHLNILGVTEADAGLFWDGARRAQLDSLRTAVREREHPPVVLLTSPLKRQERLEPGLLHAIEISDAAPRGLAYGWRHRPWLQRLADSLALAPVSGSDLHGWGRAAASWTVLHLPGWHSLGPAELDQRIRQLLRRPTTSPPLVLERPPLLGTGSTWGLILTAPLLGHAVFTRLSWRERMAWLVWSWGTWALWTLFGALRRAALWQESTARARGIALRRGVRLATISWKRRSRAAWVRAIAP